MIILLGRILRVLVVLLLVRFVLRGLAAALRPAPAAGPSGIDMVRDSVCNTFLSKGRALRATVAGQEAWFCSSACREKALAAR